MLKGRKGKEGGRKTKIFFLLCIPFEWRFNASQGTDFVVVIGREFHLSLRFLCEDLISERHVTTCSLRRREREERVKDRHVSLPLTSHATRKTNVESKQPRLPACYFSEHKDARSSSLDSLRALSSYSKYWQVCFRTSG